MTLLAPMRSEKTSLCEMQIELQAGAALPHHAPHAASAVAIAVTCGGVIVIENMSVIGQILKDVQHLIKDLFINLIAGCFCSGRRLG